MIIFEYVRYLRFKKIFLFIVVRFKRSNKDGWKNKEYSEEKMFDYNLFIKLNINNQKYILFFMVSIIQSIVYYSNFTTL